MKFRYPWLSQLEQSSNHSINLKIRDVRDDTVYAHQFWSGMQEDIRQTCLPCCLCAQYLKNERHRRYQRYLCSAQISVLDLFKIGGKHYLVSIEHYSNYFELDSLKNTIASTLFLFILLIYKPRSHEEKFLATTNMLVIDIY